MSTITQQTLQKKRGYKLNPRQPQRKQSTCAMQTFWSHLTFLYFRQPLRTCFCPWTSLSYTQHIHQTLLFLLFQFSLLPNEKIDKNLNLLAICLQKIWGVTFTLHWVNSHINHVVIRFNGDGAVVVRCILRINFDKPNFHSISDWAWIDRGVVLFMEKS